MRWAGRFCSLPAKWSAIVQQQRDQNMTLFRSEANNLLRYMKYICEMFEKLLPGALWLNAVSDGNAEDSHRGVK